MESFLNILIYTTLMDTNQLTSTGTPNQGEERTSQANKDTTQYRGQRGKGRKNTRRRRNSFIPEGWKATPTTGAKSFKLIHAQYRMKQEILPGLICYLPPLYGTVGIKLSFPYARFRDVMETALLKWAITANYTQLRSAKSLMGLRASDSDDVLFRKLASHLSWYMYNLLRYAWQSDNFYRELEDLGIDKFTMPKLFSDALHLVLNYRSVHTPKHLDKAMIQFELKELEFVGTTKLRDDFGQKIVSNDSDLFKGDNLPELDKIISFLSRVTVYTDCMTLENIEDTRIFKNIHPACFNSVISKYNEPTEDPEGKRKDDAQITMLTGIGATEFDTALPLLLGIWMVETTLSEVQYDTLPYAVLVKRVNPALKRFVLTHYMNTEDSYVSPGVTEVEREVFNRAEVESSIH
jgi:hypothetical protein